MPTYSYACTACEHRFDTVQAFSDSSLTDCPECAGRLRKLFTSVGIVFKGSGFYRNDSRSDPGGASDEGKNESKSDSAKDSPKSDPATSDSAKSDSAKSGSKSDSKSGSAKSDSAKSGSSKSGAESSTRSTPATAAS